MSVSDDRVSVRYDVYSYHNNPFPTSLSSFIELSEYQVVIDVSNEFPNEAEIACNSNKGDCSSDRLRNLFGDIRSYDRTIYNEYLAVYELFGNKSIDTMDSELHMRPVKRLRADGLFVSIFNKHFNEAAPPSIAYFKKQVLQSIYDAKISMRCDRVLILDSSVGAFKSKVIIAFDMIMSGFFTAELSVISSSPKVSFMLTLPKSIEEVPLFILSLRLNDSMSKEYLTFIDRLSLACYRDQRWSRTHLKLRNEDTNTVIDDNQSAEYLKPWPSATEGLSVFEFFSGIGGMRLSLPPIIRGVHVKSVVAYDCSDIVNDVYDYNFHPESVYDDANPWRGLHLKGELKRVLIDGLKVNDVDGKADVWTMSPPCQPFTTTKGARQLDEKDNRCRALFRLMHLLLDMKQRPRMIFLENVQGFVGSSVLASWKDALSRCGYRWTQYLLSPISCLGIPNHRMRYYMCIEHYTSISPSPWTDHEKNIIHYQITQSRPVIPPPEVRLIKEFIVPDLPVDRIAELLVTEEKLIYLTRTWASNRLSIVGDYDQTSYCFTHSYGRILDRSSGSLYLQGAEGPLSDSRYAIDKDKLVSLVGRLRFFDPEEVLLLSGFPRNFLWPDDMPLKKKWASIGNSINVAVVTELMKNFFS